MFETRSDVSAREIRNFGLLWLLFFAAVAALAAIKPAGLLGAATILGPAWLIGMLFGGGNRIRRSAGIALPVLFALAGGGARLGWPIGAIVGVCVAAGLLGALSIWAAPALGRALYAGWMEAAAPIGWTITRLILGAVYYLVLTPIGLLMRLFGKDPMNRNLDRTAATYWCERRGATEARRYFRQF